MNKTVLTKSVLRVLPLGVFFMVMGLVSCNSELDTGTELPWEATESGRACITGTIVEIVIDYQHLEDYNPQVLEDVEEYVFIGGLKFSEEDEKQYGYMETVIVPKEKFPIPDYQFGDVISFKIVEVLSSYPTFQLDKCTAYICEIELHE